MRRTIYALCLLGAIATMIAGCGSSGTTASGGGSSDTQTSNTSDVGVAVISAKRIPNFAEVLVDSRGRTLYVFSKDKHSLYSAMSSACYGACAEDWPPLLTEGEPEANNGAFPTKLSTLKRKDGTLQVTYYGHPLYTYVGDKETGDTNGNDINAFGGKWKASSPSH